MARRPKTGTDVGERLVALRKARGLTQTELAEKIGSSQRAISYYENQADYPPAELLPAFAKALGVSVDEILGVKTLKRPTDRESPEVRRLWKKFQQVLALPEKDQRAVIRLVNSLSIARTPGRRSA